MKILFVSGSRAEFDLISGVLRLVATQSSITPHLAVTGSHLSEHFGNTQQYITDLGFIINDRVQTPTLGGGPADITSAISATLTGISGILEKDEFKLVVLLGDRYETFAAAQAALCHNVPILHLCGGDLTEGAIDEAFRHSISKMSHYHCVTNANSREILLQLGENPKTIWVSGSPALDYIEEFKPIGKAEFKKKLNISSDGPLLLVTYHPTTWHSCEDYGQELFAALRRLSSHMQISILFTAANADSGGKEVNKLKMKFCEANDRSVFTVSLGREMYFNALSHSDVMVGNSSSAFYEAPSFGLPCVNIGDRQTGRIYSDNIVTSSNIENDIVSNILKCLSMGKVACRNPYMNGNASRVIFDVIHEAVRYGNVLGKRFYKLDGRNFD